MLTALTSMLQRQRRPRRVRLRGTYRIGFGVVVIVVVLAAGMGANVMRHALDEAAPGVVTVLAVLGNLGVLTIIAAAYMMLRFT